MKGRALLLLAAVVLVPATTFAHVGSPDVFLEGAAGPYHVRVTIRAPSVIPGLADIIVQAPGAASVEVQPFLFDAPGGGAPPPDKATPVPGFPGLFEARLWLMSLGSYAVRVEVAGTEGKGRLHVPVAPTPGAPLAMQRGLGTTLSILGAVLVVGLLGLVNSAFREGLLEPGLKAGPDDRTRGRRAALVALLVAVLAVLGGRAWWRSVDEDYRADLYHPTPLRADLARADGAGVLLLSLGAPEVPRHAHGPLIPEHGKLMHLFLVRADGGEAIAHLHPVFRDEGHFAVTLPPLPEGGYRVFADITHLDGFAETLTATIHLPPVGVAEDPGAPAIDPDDAWRDSGPAVGPGEVAPLSRGLGLKWERSGAPRARAPAELSFAFSSEDGEAVPIDPYMGMLGHAVVFRTDGKVFAHLHPSGNASMAAEMAFDAKYAGTGMAMGSGGRSFSRGDRLSFPYEFPTPGDYRVAVQVRPKGSSEILTALFRTRVD